MKPTTFEGQNSTFAENQPPYIPLPAYKGEDGEVISCWQLTWRERLQVLWSGLIWSRILTFNKPLQPQVLQTSYPFEKGQ